MELYPAIDIRAGRAVRLRHGRFDQQTVYADDPLEAARTWVEAGARRLHVVDLDGAREGRPVALHHVAAIASELDVPVQYGGGLRTVDAVRAAIEAGAERVIVGTAAFRDVDFLDEIVATWRARVMVAIDARGGRVSTAGWTQDTGLPVDEAARRLCARGVSSFVYTDVDRDGGMLGADLEAVARVAGAIRGHFIYSGGIGTLEHLEALRDLRQVNLTGVIVGKALYEQRFTVAEAQAILAQ